MLGVEIEMWVRSGLLLGVVNLVTAALFVVMFRLPSAFVQRKALIARVAGSFFALDMFLVALQLVHGLGAR